MGTLAKARFLQDRFAAESGSQDERLRNVARSIGSRSDYVGRLLVALRLYHHIAESSYFEIPDLSETRIEFSLISSVLAYNDIVEYLGLDSSRDLDMPELNLERLELLTRVLFQRTNRVTQLGESRNIKLLATVLAHPKGPVTLQAGLSVVEASRVLGGTTEAFRGLLASAHSSLILAAENVTAASVEPEDLRAIELVQEVAVGLRDVVSSKLEGR